MKICNQSFAQKIRSEKKSSRANPAIILLKDKIENMTIAIYTLKTCDTCKKALKWLEENNLQYENHDVRDDGLTRLIIEKFVKQLGVDTAVNKRSTTWRTLTDQQKEALNAENAVSLIEANPTLMKRPVFVIGDKVLAGFSDTVKQSLSEV